MNRYFVKKCIVYKIFDSYEKSFYSFGKYNDYNFSYKCDADREAAKMNNLYFNSISIVNSYYKNKTRK